MRWWWRRRRVVRTRRIEVVDGGGRPWLVIGTALGPAATRGLWVLGPDGTHRLWLGVDDAGAGLAVGRGGTVVGGIGTLDGDLGAYAFVSDRTGRPVAGWYVDDATGLRVVDEAP